MNRSPKDLEPGHEREREPETAPELEGISPLNPSTFPRAEDDEETRARSREFHDHPDPAPDTGRKS